jgi:hypothetical protein
VEGDIVLAKTEHGPAKIKKLLKRLLREEKKLSIIFMNVVMANGLMKHQNTCLPHMQPCQLKMPGNICAS